MNRYNKDEQRPDWEHKFHHTRCLLNEYILCVDDFEALAEKGVHPHAYMSSVDKFEETELSPIEYFHNDLSEEACPQEIYKRALDVWDRCHLDTLGEYHDIYLLTDVGLLSDVFEHFRNLCIEFYGLDCAHDLTLPHFGWDAMLKKTGIQLDPLTDINMFNMVEDGKRGGMVQVCKRHAKAENKHLNPETHEGDSNYMMQLDTHNLYGWAMSQ